MADLGALNLILGADLSPLEASLGRADELINRSAAQMQKSFAKPFKFKVEVGDLAVQLTQAEGVVDRSIRQVRSLVRQPIKFNVETGELNVQLAEAEALVNRSIQDIKAMDRSIAFNLSVGGLDDVEGVVARSIQRMSALSNSVLTIQVDDKRLTELNQHLDAKQAHYARVQQQFATPLKVLVDDSQLTVLNQKLTATEQHLSTVAGKFATTKLTPAIDLTNLNLLDNRLNNSIEHLNRTQSAFSKPIVTNVDSRQLLELEDLLDRVEKPHKLRLDLPDTLGGLTSAMGKLVLSPVTIPLKIAQNSLEGIFRGAFEGLGRDLSRNFSKGFSTSIEQFITKKTGMSTGEMGTKSGKYVGKNSYLYGEYISRAQGYENGMRGVGEDVRRVGGAIDQVVNPIKFRRNVRKVEGQYVAYQEKINKGDTEGAEKIREEALKPLVEGAQTIAKRAAGVGLRIAAQPYRIRKRVRLAQSIDEAGEQAKDLEIPNYDRQKAEESESINLVMGGIDFNGTRNTAFASRLMGQVMPKGYTVPLTTPFSNIPVEKSDNLVDKAMRVILTQMAGGDPDAVSKMPVSKLLEIAVSKGYNPDAIRGYAHVKKIREMHPDKPINVMGTSGGSAVAEEIISMAERDGDKNVRGLGIGLPFHGLTGTAGKQFKGTIGDLDPLGLSAYGTQYTQRKLTAEQLTKLPFSGNGLLAPDRARSSIIPNAGADHNIGMFSVNQNFQDVARKQLGSFINPDLSSRQGIVNLNPYVQFGAMDQDLNIPRTLKAMYGDKKARKDIVVGGEYSYYQPNHPEWRRDSDFGMMKEETRSKLKGAKGLPREHADEYLGFLDTMQSDLTAFYESKGKIKPQKSLQEAAKYYPELRELATKNGGTGIYQDAFQYREQPQKAKEPSKAFNPITDEAQYDRFVGTSEKLAAKARDKKRRKSDDPWSDNYVEPQLEVPNPFVTEDRPKVKIKREPKKRNRKQRGVIYGEFVDEKGDPGVGSSTVNPFTAASNTPKIEPIATSSNFNSAVDKFAMAVDRFSNQKVDLRPKVNIPAQPVEVGALQTLAADAARASGGLAVKTAKAGAGWLQNPVSQAVQNTAGGIGKGYRMAERAENLVFQVIPGASLAKKAVTGIAAPMGVAYAAAQSPVVGGAIGGLMDMAGGSIGGIGNALVDAGTSLMPWGLKSLFGSIGHGAVDLASTYAPALYGGKLALNTGKELMKKAFPGFSRNPENKEAENRKKLDSSEIEQMKASVQAELQALKNFQSLITPDAPKITPQQDLAAQNIIADYEREQENKLNQKFDRLSTPGKAEPKAKQSQPQSVFASNIQEIDVGNTKAIQSEVQRVSTTIKSNRQSIVKKLNSDDPQEVAQGLLEAEKFGYGLKILRGDLESVRNKIAPAKLADPSNAKNLESSRKSIDGFLNAPGAQTTPIQEAVTKVSTDASLVDRVNPYLPAQSRGNIFENIKLSLLRNLRNNDGGYGVIPDFKSIADRFKKLTQSPLAQTRVPGLDFLDKPISLPKWLRNPFIKANPVQDIPEQPEPATQTRKPPLSTLEKEAASRLKQIQERELAARQKIASFQREATAYRAKSNDPWLLEMGQTTPRESSFQYPRQKTQLALPPAPQRPPAPPQPDPWKSTTYSNKSAFETKKLLSREERLAALNSQIADREDPLRKFPPRPRGGEIVVSSSRSLAINSQAAEDLYPRSIQRKLPAGIQKQPEYLQVVAEIPSAARTIQQSPARLSLPPSPPPRPSGFSQAAEQFKENPIETIRAAIILAESQARKAVRNAKSTITDALENSRGKDYLDRASITARSVVDDVKEKFTKVKQTFGNQRQNPATANRTNPNNAPSPNPVESVESAGKSVAASGNVAAQAIAPYDLIRASLSKLGDAGKLALGVFGGFTLLTMGVPAIIGLGKSVIDTAANFETLQVKLAAASDSAQTGKLTFSRLTGQADKLGISRSSALETGAFIGGTTFGTELEGKPTDRMTSQILQIAQARGLSKEQTSGLNLALSQTLGRSRTSMQEINQLTQSAGITDARVIAAKGLGYTPQQFSAIQDSPTGIDSKRFVQAFLAQGVQDSLSAKDLAQSSIGFKQEKMNAGVERLQGNVGGGFSPAYKAGLDLLTGSIEMLNSGIEKSSTLLTMLGLKLLYVGTTALLPIILNSKLAGIAVNGMISGFSNLPQLGIGVAKLAAQFVLLGVAAEVINQIGKSFQNTSQEIEDAAAKIGKSVDEINGKKVDPIGKPATAEDIGGQDWGESAKLWLQRGVKGAFKKQSEISETIIDSPVAVGLRNALGIKVSEADRAKYKIAAPVDDKQKEQSDRIVAVDKVLTKSSEAIASVNPAIQKSQALAGIDLELNQLDSKRSSLFAGGDPDASQLASINAKYNAKYQERDKLTSDITPTRTAIQEAINGLKGTKAKLELDFSKGQIAVPDYELAMKSVTGKLEEAEQAQRNLNDAIKSGFDNLLPWTTSLDKIVTSFEDIKTNAGEAASKLSIARNNLETGGKITKGQAEYQGSIDQQRNLQSQIEKNIATVKELKAALNTKDPKAVENVQKNYGVDDSTSGAQLRLKADKATSIVDKEILSKLAVIKDQEINLSGLQSQLSDSRKETYRRIDQENRDMAVYYLGLARQVDPKDLQLEKKIATITQNRNNFLAKLNNFGTGIADGYIQAVLDIFDATKKRFEIQQQDYQARKRAIESFQDRKVDNDNRTRNAYVAPSSSIIEPSSAPSNSSEAPSTPDRTMRSEPTSPVTPPPPTIVPAQTIRRSTPKIKPQISAPLGNLTPAERKRYLTTTMSVDGKTDLGLDDFDRRVLGMGGGIPGVKVKKIPVSPYVPQNVSNDPNVVRAINNGTYKSTIPVKTASTETTTRARPNSTGGSTNFITEQVSAINSFLSGGSAKSKEILEQENARNEEKNKIAQSENNLQEMVARQKAREAAIKSKREVEKQTRQQEFAVRNAKPQKTIQEKQQRELEDFDFNTNETKISATQYKEDLGYQVGNLNELLKEYKSKPALKPEDIKEIERLTKLRNVFAAELKRMGTLSSGLEAKIATARAEVKEQQKYDREVSVEQTSIKERETKRGAIEAERTGIQQKIKTQPFNDTLKATDRKLEEDSAMLTIQNEEVQALRALIDRERNGDFNIGRTPAQVKAYMAGERKKILGTSASKRKDVKENRSQQSSVAQFTTENEKRGFDINARNLHEQVYDARDRIQTIDDKGDAPFSNDTAILQARDKKLRGIVNRKVAINKKYKEDKVKYAGSPFLADVKKQYKYSNVIDTEEAVVANKEYNFSIQEQARQRKASTYQRQRSQFEADVEILGAKTQQRKLMGQDTRVTDYETRVTAIQDESNQKRFNYQQQKDAITGTTPQAAALKAELDKLIASATRLENIKLNNLKAEFNQINDVIRDTQQNTGDVIKKWIGDMSKPFDWLSLVTKPLISIANQQIDKITAALFSPLYKSPEAPNANGKTSGSSVVDATQSVADKIFATPGGAEKDAIESNPGLKNPIEQAANTSPLIVAIENLTETIKSTPIESKVASEPQTTLPTLQEQNGYINQNSSLDLDASPLLNYKQQSNSPDNILDYPPDPTPENTIGSPPKRSILVPSFDIPPDPTPENTIGSPPERSNLGRMFDIAPPPTTREDIVPSTKIFQPQPSKKGIPKLNASSLFMDMGESLMGTINPFLDPLMEPKLDADLKPKPKKKSIPKLNTGDVFLDVGASLLQSLFGFADGGIKGAAEKGIAPVVNGIIGSGRSQVDNRLTFVEDGEGILTHRGIDALGGAMALSKLNKGIKLENIPRFANGGVKGANYSTPKPNTNVPTLTNNASSLSNVNASVTINNSDGKSSVNTKEDGTRLGGLINNAISAALVKEKRPGGLLYT